MTNDKREAIDSRRRHRLLALHRDQVIRACRAYEAAGLAAPAAVVLLDCGYSLARRLAVLDVGEAVVRAREEAARRRGGRAALERLLDAEQAQRLFEVLAASDKLAEARAAGCIAYVALAYGGMAGEALRVEVAAAVP